jgi:vacuolar-type H+-ATPase subunit F/Vma7
LFKVLVITDREIGIGFQLAGTEVLEVNTASEAETLLRECLADESYGIILINEDYLPHFSARTKSVIEESTIPLVIPIPVRMKWEFEERKSDYLNNLIKRSIGYQINFH